MANFVTIWEGFNDPIFEGTPYKVQGFLGTISAA
jgi:hypothetical protein